MTKAVEWHVRPAKTLISLGIRPVWSESSLSALRKLGSLATHWAHSEDSDQTGRMSRLIWVFAHVILLVLPWGGPFEPSHEKTDLSVVRFEILQTHIRSLYKRSEVWFFAWSFPLLYESNSEGSCETARMHRLAWAFAGRISNKYSFHMDRLI